MTRTRRLFAVGTLIATALVAAGGCGPIGWTPGGGGAGTGSGPGCLVGDWDLEHETITGPLSSFLGDLGVTATGDGVSLEFTAGTWTLDADQTLSVDATTKWGSVSGTATVDATASGSYTADDDSVTFTLESVTGTVAVSADVFGHTAQFNASLPTSGLQHLYGLSGDADYTCSADALTLEFADVTMTF